MFLVYPDILDCGISWLSQRPSRSPRVTKSCHVWRKIVKCSFLGPTYHTNNLIREKEHAQLESLSRNRVLNISALVSLIGEIFILAIMVGILKAVKSEETTENNTRAFSILLAFSGGIWRESLHQLVHTWVKRWDHPSPLCVAMVYLWEKTTRPGSTRRNWSISCWDQASLCRNQGKLKQTFLYFLFYFLMSAFHSRHSTFPLMMIQGAMCSTPHCMMLVTINSMTYGLHRTVVATLQNRYDSLKLAASKSLTDRSIVVYSTLDLTFLSLWTWLHRPLASSKLFFVRCIRFLTWRVVCIGLSNNGSG